MASKMGCYLTVNSTPIAKVHIAVSSYSLDRLHHM